MPFRAHIQPLLSELELTVEKDLLTEPAYVALVQRSDGSPAVFKIGRLDYMPDQIEALRLWNGQGMVCPLWSDPSRGAVLMECIQPGTNLVRMAETDDDRATEIIVQSILQMPRVPYAESSSLPTLPVWLEGIDRLRAAVKRGEAPGNVDHILRARDLSRELANQLEPLTLMHCDLHHENVLHSGENQWIPIDPMGVWGAPVAEFYALLRNPDKWVDQLPDLNKVLTRRLEIIAANTPWERFLIRDWALVMVTLSQWWFHEDAKVEDLPPLYYKDGEVAQILLKMQSARK